MDMGLDREGRPQLLAGSHSDGRSDWHGLRARLAAAYAARPVLEAATVRESTVEGGSFDCFAARMLAVYGLAAGGRLDRVNPTVLGNGKSTHDYDAAVAGALTAGD
jgi:hypothetical protein